MSRSTSYTEFFGLKEQPFAPTADPAYFYATRDHKSCLFRLWNSIDECHGIAVILGSYGTGKTTLLRKLMTGMAADTQRYNTAVLASPIPSWTTFSLLEAILKQFGLNPGERTFGEYMETLNQYLLANRDRISTLIIDDAQNLNKRGQLELLRLAQNLETPQHKLLNLVCFSQLEWIQVLQAAPNFHQRINLTYTLSPLTVADLNDMIQFRLEQAGGIGPRAPIFDTKAVEAIHSYSEGNPRVIVTLCRNSLLLAAQVNEREITRDLVLHTIEKTTLPKLEKAAPVAEGAKRERPVPQATPVKVAAESKFVFGNPEATRTHTFGRRANQLLMQASQARQE